MTKRDRSQLVLREALLDAEEPLADLRAAVVALRLVATAPQGIETGDMVGLAFLARKAEDLANHLHGCWRVAVRRLSARDGADV